MSLIITEGALSAPPSSLPPARVRVRPIIAPAPEPQLAPETRSLPPARPRTRPQRIDEAAPPLLPAPDPAVAATNAEPESAVLPVKRGRGRPRKHPPKPEGAAKKDYDVGYGKPPVETRFKKGSSGNPSGRPQGSQSLQSIVDEVFGETITARINGRVFKLTKGKAIVAGAAQAALAGDRHARADVLKMLARSDARRPPEAEIKAEDLAARVRDEEIASTFLESKGWQVGDVLS